MQGTLNLSAKTVADAMHEAVYWCPTEAILSEVARIMAERRVHAVVVADDPSETTSLGVISDLDVIAAATVRDLDDQFAGGSAWKPALTVTPTDTLEIAAELMTRHGSAHLVVVDGSSGRPIGVLSTTDIVDALAGLSSAPVGARPVAP